MRSTLQLNIINRFNISLRVRILLLTAVQIFLSLVCIMIFTHICILQEWIVKSVWFVFTSVAILLCTIIAWLFIRLYVNSLAIDIIFAVLLNIFLPITLCIISLIFVPLWCEISMCVSVCMAVFTGLFAIKMDLWRPSSSKWLISMLASIVIVGIISSIVLALQIYNEISMRVLAFCALLGSLYMIFTLVQLVWKDKVARSKYIFISSFLYLFFFGVFFFILVVSPSKNFPPNPTNNTGNYYFELIKPFHFLNVSHRSRQ
uniref:Uncharacterized protein n=1 Tax=Trichobilharzia regenti TaxID=157069 RepID=A0AA85IWC1_TRIRE|nr:unnamed protein product [Trichobilharzia regenti]